MPPHLQGRPRSPNVSPVVRLWISLRVSRSCRGPGPRFPDEAPRPPGGSDATYRSRCAAGAAQTRAESPARRSTGAARPSGIARPGLSESAPRVATRGVPGHGRPCASGGKRGARRGAQATAKPTASGAPGLRSGPTGCKAVTPNPRLLRHAGRTHSLAPHSAAGLLPLREGPGNPARRRRRHWCVTGAPTPGSARP